MGIASTAVRDFTRLKNAIKPSLKEGVSDSFMMNYNSATCQFHIPIPARSLLSLENDAVKELAARILAIHKTLERETTGIILSVEETVERIVLSAEMNCASGELTISRPPRDSVSAPGGATYKLGDGAPTPPNP